MGAYIGFIIGAGVLLAVVVGILARALWRGAQQGSTEPIPSAQEVTQANTQVYRDQLQDLERDYTAGHLSAMEFETARDELALRLLEDVSPAPALPQDTAPFQKPKRAVWALGVAFPLLAFALYSVIGTPIALDPAALQQGEQTEAEVTPEKLASMATALTRRLQDEPNSAEGWIMLGRVQRARSLFSEADEAFAKALALTQDDDLWIERAEVLAQKNNGSFAGEPWALIQRVLTRNPQHINALLLAGSAAFSELNYRAALRFWERARDLVDAQSPDAPELERAMAQARDKLGLPPLPARTPEPTQRATLAATSISGRVSVINELAGKVAPTDTVFVYATPVAGSKMPLAIVRTTANRLPFDFVLDDSTAMNPNVKLSSQTEVTVRVRISKSGQAQAQSGDLGVSLTPVKPGSHGLNLMVRDVLP